MQLRHHTDYWEERADKVLSHFSYTYPDEIDLYDICWRYGIRVLPLESPSIEGIAINKHLKAFSIPKDHARRGTIFIKDGLDAIENKMLLAEEFCHLYAHHQSHLSVDQYTIGKCENQAKRMSAYLLMPGEFIEDVYADAYEAPVVISDIADYFLVTDEAAAYRMELIFNHRVDVLLSTNGRLGTIEQFH